MAGHPTGSPHVPVLLNSAEAIRIVTQIFGQEKAKESGRAPMLRQARKPSARSPSRRCSDVDEPSSKG